MKYLFFLLIPFVLIVPAYAEVGKNFDTIENPDGTTTWTSHYDRVFDGDSWENYILTQSGAKVRVETANIIFEFDKISCDLRLYDPVTKELVIQSFKSDLLIDGVKQVIPVCPVTNLTPTEDKITFNVQRGAGFVTHFELEPINGLEWTYEIDNNKGKASTFTIEETCKDCSVFSIDGDKIDFGVYILDTKNNEIDPITGVNKGHQTFKDARINQGDYVIEFEKTIPDKETLIIDPIFTISTTTLDGFLNDDQNDEICNAVPSSISRSTADALIPVGMISVAGGVDCREAFFEWNISSIPDSVSVANTVLLYEVETTDGGPANCDYYELGNIPTSTASNSWIWSAIMNNNGSTALVSNNADCKTAANNKSLDLGTSADSRLEAQLVNDRFVLGIRGTGNVGTGTDATNHQVWFASNDDNDPTPRPTLQVTFSATNAVTDLIATDIRPTAVDLDWTAPTIFTGTIVGYQVNNTTPWNPNVATIIVNNTASTTTAYTVSGLVGNTQYSFRIGVWSSLGGGNMSGNVLNITTDVDPTGGFTVGTFTLNYTGTDSRPMSFERDDINNTALFLNVTYDDTVDLACDLSYKFANNVDTYTIFTNSSAGAGRVESPILFLDVDNEIIQVDCYDEDGSNATGRYLITQTFFPLLEHISLFRAGEYGTSGDFGALDFITLIAIILSMVGLNRVNESVGLVFSIAIIGGLAVFGIIEWPTIMTASLVLIALLVISSTRKE